MKGKKDETNDQSSLFLKKEKKKKKKVKFFVCFNKTHKRKKFLSIDDFICADYQKQNRFFFATEMGFFPLEHKFLRSLNYKFKF